MVVIHLNGSLVDTWTRPESKLFAKWSRRMLGTSSAKNFGNYASTGWTRELVKSKNSDASTIACRKIETMCLKPNQPLCPSHHRVLQPSLGNSVRAFPFLSMLALVARMSPIKFFCILFVPLLFLSKMFKIVNKAWIDFKLENSVLLDISFACFKCRDSISKITEASRGDRLEKWWSRWPCMKHANLTVKNHRLVE